MFKRVWGGGRRETGGPDATRLTHTHITGCAPVFVLLTSTCSPGGDRHLPGR